MERPPLARHPEKTLSLGLRVLAKVGGNVKLAHSILAEELEHPPGRQTLKKWKTQHASRYQEMLAEERQNIDAWSADRGRELAAKALSGSEQLVDKTLERIEEIDPKDLARSAYNLTQVTSEQVKTSRLLEERPTSITEIRDPSEILKELSAMGIVKADVIEAKAIEE